MIRFGYMLWCRPITSRTVYTARGPSFFARLKTVLVPYGTHLAHVCGTQENRPKAIKPLTCESSGRVDWIRTSDPLTPSVYAMPTVDSLAVRIDIIPAILYN